MPNKSNWDKAYQQDPETKLIIDHLSISSPLDQTTILRIRTGYRTTIACNQIWFLDGRLIYYEYISFANKYICRIAVSSSLRYTICNLMNATPVTGHMGEYKRYTELAFDTFDLECVQTLKNRSNNVLIVCSNIVGDVVVKSYFFLCQLVLPSLYFL